MKLLHIAFPLIVVCFLAKPTKAFLPASIAPETSLHATLSPTESASSSLTPQEDSQALLNALLEQYRSSENTDYDVNAAIQRLKAAQVTFDPAECFNGPLYAVLHQQGPKKPLWEKIGIQLGQTNRQGQKYAYDSATQVYDLVNYAEILGKGLFIQVEGTAENREKKVSQPTSNEESGPPSFLDGIANLFSGSATQEQQSKPDSTNAIRCPCEIVATVAGGGLYVGGNKLLALDFIQGTGVVRVLYADPRLRILESPYQNNGGWEDQGLIVVQVREDLIA